MKKPRFEFSDYTIKEINELLELYERSANEDESNSIIDLAPFFEQLKMIKDSLISGKNFKPFPKLSFNAKKYCIDLYNHIEKLREELATKKSVAISKQNKSLKIQQELESKFTKLDSNFKKLEESSVYPEYVGQSDVINHFFRKNNINRDYFYNKYKTIISDRTASLENEKLIFYPEIAQYFTIIETDKILLENGMNDYGLYEVTRSNHPQITKGIHFYSFDDADNLLILGAPYQVLTSNHSQYIVFDSRLYDTNKLVRIPKSEILSFKLYGTELMQSTVSTNTRPSELKVFESQLSEKYQRPSITGTFFSALLFGSTYTLLNGVGKSLHNQTNVLGNKLDSLGGQLDRVVEAINNISITTDHKIIDTSRVQIVLSNRRDLEIDGINIFYDLNRVYPNLDKPSNDSVPKLEEKAPSSTNMADEVLKLKQLLDQGIIDEEEFKAMKKKLIN